MPDQIPRSATLGDLRVPKGLQVYHLWTTEDGNQYLNHDSNWRPLTGGVSKEVATNILQESDSSFCILLDADFLITNVELIEDSRSCPGVNLAVEESQTLPFDEENAFLIEAEMMERNYDFCIAHRENRPARIFVDEECNIESNAEVIMGRLVPHNSSNISSYIQSHV